MIKRRSVAIGMILGLTAATSLVTWAMLPDKDYQGSYLASRSSIIQYRKPLLQKFLHDLVLHKVPSVKIKKFLDFDGKGASGVK